MAGVSHWVSSRIIAELESIKCHWEKHGKNMIKPYADSISFGPKVINVPDDPIDKFV